MTDRFTQAGQAFEALCRTMAVLRGPEGCPWDREQTLQSLKPHLLEEAYEAVDAMDDADADPLHLCEELGDVLLQIVFQADIAQARGAFDIQAVVETLRHKLIRRHPHVFGDGDPTVHNAQEALQTWQAVKATEKPSGTHNRWAQIPKAMPSLMRAVRIADKAAQAGFDWPDASGPTAKVCEEWNELQHARAHQPQAVSEEMGDVLWALVNLCRHLKVDPEGALHASLHKVQKRLQYVETVLTQQGQELEKTPLDERNRLWDEAKIFEQHGPDLPQGDHKSDQQAQGEHRGQPSISCKAGPTKCEAGPA